MDVAKKIFKLLSALPAFASIFKSAAVTGKIDPIETLQALTTLSPSVKKVSDTALNVAQNGGNIQDVMQRVQNIGEVEIMGTKVDTRDLTGQLKQAGGFCMILGNMLEKMQTQSPEEIASFGEHATKVENWQDILSAAKV